MATWIDWHSHHTAPEAVETFAEFTGKRPKIDDYDSTDFAERVHQMDEVGIDLQLICQGAGLYADQLPADQALAVVRQSNAMLAERISPHHDRLIGVTAVSLKNIDASVEELERTSKQGFGAALLYPTMDGEMVVDLPMMNPIYTKLADLGWPIFLHGAGMAKNHTLKRLEDDGAGVAYAVLSDAEISECALRMIASGVFDRYPNLRIVIRSSGGGLPLLLHRFFWKHKGPTGERRYSEIFREHFLIDCASSDARTLSFLIDTMGERGIVFGSDYCGGLGPLNKAFNGVSGIVDPESFRRCADQNSRKLLHI
jgi:predicted TIM-barrel fold metal-dependent hydrolase